MFYEVQPAENQQNYKEMLRIVGSLSALFSDSDCPYLAYRAHENIFCKYMQADNMARHDDSSDAVKDGIGIGLKTWTGQDVQKVAEFGRLRTEYVDLHGLDLVRRISYYRNERIRVTKNAHGLDSMVYHIVKRVPGAMKIYEAGFDYIDIDSIELLRGARHGVNTTYFTDGRHTYNFNSSKNTLYMVFSDMVELDSIPVEIIADPFTVLFDLFGRDITDQPVEEIAERILADRERQLCLPLYSRRRGEPFVPEKSGVNQWNAAGRRRDPDELYIPYSQRDKRRNPAFFPPRDTRFTLHLPDGSECPAKVCQDGGKAIMSDPNKALGHWLLRQVFEIPELTLLTYEDLLRFGVDCVVFTKNADRDYSVDFGTVGTYESFYGEPDEEE